MSCCQNKDQGCQKSQETVPDYLVCTCMGVMYSEIKSAVENGSKSFDSLSDKLGVGTGCSSCVAEVEAILTTTLRGDMSTGCCKS